MNRIAVLTLLCCFPSCTSNEAPVQQSSEPSLPSSSATSYADSVAVFSSPPNGSCPGLPTLDKSMLPEDTPDTALQLFLVSPTRFGNTEASLSRCLGTPLEVTVDTVSNIHTGEPDNILHVLYPGIQYTIYRVLADGKEIVFKVEAFAPTEELALGIRVGSPWSLVLEELGTPAYEEQGEAGGFVARYVVEQFAEETVTFWIQDGTVSKITWDYYID